MRKALSVFGLKSPSNSRKWSGEMGSEGTSQAVVVIALSTFARIFQFTRKITMKATALRTLQRKPTQLDHKLIDMSFFHVRVTGPCNMSRRKRNRMFSVAREKHDIFCRLLLRRFRGEFYTLASSHPCRIALERGIQKTRCRPQQS